MKADAISGLEQFLKGINIDSKSLGIEETPERVTDLFTKLFSGLEKNSKDAFGDLFPTDSEGLVALLDIPYYSTCEHHLVPFFGKIDIIYKPHNGIVAGLGNFEEVIKVFALRPQLQERLTQNIADAIMEDLQAEGVLVRVSATQLCMILNGEMSYDTKVFTMETRGSLAAGQPYHQEAMLLLGGNQHE